MPSSSVGIDKVKENYVMGNIELTEISINQLIRAVSQDAVALYGKHSNDLVDELRVEVSKLISTWCKRLLKPENSNIPIAFSVIRYECEFGLCDKSDYGEYDLFWMKHELVGGVDYVAGWYCINCIEDRNNEDLSFGDKQKLISLAKELKRREVGNCEKEVFKIK